VKSFQSNGVVVLNDILSEEWIAHLRSLFMDVVSSPTLWDIVYTRMVANFYGAQKNIFLHHTSICGKEIALSAPTTLLAAQLLQSNTVRVCEPSEAILNYASENSGHSSWHQDGVYMPFEKKDPGKRAIVRFWIPLLSYEENEMRFQALNNSESCQQERNFDVLGADFLLHEQIERDEAKILPRQILEPRYRPGSIIAFAGDTPHYAEALNCDHHTCPRLILSFSGDNAMYTSGKHTGLLPINDNQTDGLGLQGIQFPQVYPEKIDWEWEPLTPTYGEICRVTFDSFQAGSKAFVGVKLSVVKDYVYRVVVPLFGGMWAIPYLDANGVIKHGFETLSISKHIKSLIYS